MFIQTVSSLSLVYHAVSTQKKYPPNQCYIPLKNYLPLRQKQLNYTVLTDIHTCAQGHHAACTWTLSKSKKKKKKAHTSQSIETQFLSAYVSWWCRRCVGEENEQRHPAVLLLLAMCSCVCVQVCMLPCVCVCEHELLKAIPEAAARVPSQD